MKWVIDPDEMVLPSATVRDLGWSKRINLNPCNCAKDVSMNACPEAPISFIAWVLWTTPLLTIVQGSTKWSHLWLFKALADIVKSLFIGPWGRLGSRTSLLTRRRKRRGHTAPEPLNWWWPCLRLVFWMLKRRDSYGLLRYDRLRRSSGINPNYCDGPSLPGITVLFCSRITCPGGLLRYRSFIL